MLLTVYSILFMFYCKSTVKYDFLQEDMRKFSINFRMRNLRFLVLKFDEKFLHSFFQEARIPRAL